MHIPLLLSLSLLPAVQDSLEEHALFSRLKLQNLECCPQIRLLAESPRRADPAHAATVTELFGPWLAAVNDNLLREYITPNRLESVGPDELIVVCLAGLPSYRNAARYEANPTHLSERVLWVDKPGLIVTRWDASLKRAPIVELRGPVLVRAAERMMLSYQRSSQPLEAWLLDGVAGYLTAHQSDSTADGLLRPPASPAAMARLSEVLADDQRRGAFLIPLDRMMGVREEAEKIRLGLAHAQRAGLEVTARDAGDVFREQAALWVHFFHRARGGRYLEAFRHYVAKALHGEGGPDELALGVGVSDLALLQGPFVAYLDMLAGGGVVDLPEVELPPEEPLLHADLLTAPEDLQTQLADTLGRAARGDFERAILMLEAYLVSARESEVQDRLAVEQERLKTARDARDHLIDSLVGSKRKLRFSVDGESTVAGVLAFEDGVLTLSKNKQELTHLEAARLLPADLLRSMGSKAPSFGPPWLAAYLSLLGEDPRWARKLDSSDVQGAALAAAQDELVRLIHEGLARASLRDLARTPAPSAPFEAEAIQARIAKLLAEYPDASATNRARPGLRTLANSALEVFYDRRGLRQLLKGDLQELSDGRVRVTYEFDDPQEAADFFPAPGYLQQRASAFFKVNVPSEQAGLKIQGGNLEGHGHAVYRHVLGFQAPMVIRYQLIYGRARPGKGINAKFMLGICDDGAGSFIGAWDLFDLEVLDRESRHAATDLHEGERLLRPAHTYDVELTHDGERARLMVEGGATRELVVGPRKSGAVLLWLHSEVVLGVRRMEIEGRLLKGPDNPARRAWVEERLTRLGLGQ